MSTAGGYLNRVLFLYFSIALVALIGLALGLDLMENARNILSGDERPAVLARYALLRLPAIASQSNPIAALIGALLAVETLRRHRELVALWTTGLAPGRLMSMLLPVAVLLSSCQFVVDDRLVPATATELRDWGVGPYARQASAQAGEPFVWLLSGPHVIRLADPAAAEGGLRDITIFRRSEDGVLLERLDARAARKEGADWVLLDVVSRTVADPRPKSMAALPWRDPIDPAVLTLAAVEPRNLPIEVIDTVIAHRGYGQLPVAPYRTWFHHRIAGALAPAIMIFLAVSLAKGTGRRQGTGRLLAAGLAIGFGFLIYDGIVLALGEAGWLPAWFAAWSPKLVMACAIALLTLEWASSKSPAAERLTRPSVRATRTVAGRRNKSH